MAVRSICATHGPFVGSRCPECRAASNARPKPETEARKIRSSALWQAARKRVLARDGNRCTFGTRIGERYWNGRCPVVIQLDVHHVVPIEDGGAALDEANLRTLCSTHHRQLEAALRRERREADSGE